MPRLELLEVRHALYVERLVPRGSDGVGHLLGLDACNASGCGQSFKMVAELQNACMHACKGVGHLLEALCVVDVPVNKRPHDLFEVLRSLQLFEHVRRGRLQLARDRVQHELAVVGDGVEV